MKQLTLTVLCYVNLAIFFYAIGAVLTGDTNWWLNIFVNGMAAAMTFEARKLYR